MQCFPAAAKALRANAMRQRTHDLRTDHQRDGSIVCSVGHGASSARDLCTDTAKLWCQSPGLSSVFCMPQPRFLMAKVNDRRLLPFVVSAVANMATA